MQGYEDGWHHCATASLNRQKLCFFTYYQQTLILSKVTTHLEIQWIIINIPLFCHLVFYCYFFMPFILTRNDEVRASLWQTEISLEFVLSPMSRHFHWSMDCVRREGKAFSTIWAPCKNLPYRKQFSLLPGQGFILQYKVVHKYTYIYKTKWHVLLLHKYKPTHQTPNSSTVSAPLGNILWREFYCTPDRFASRINRVAPD